MTISLRSKEIGIGRSDNLLALIRHAAIHEVIVRLPELATVIGKGSALHDESDGELLAGDACEHLNGINLWSTALADKADVQHAVVSRGNVTEDALVGDILAHG